MNIKDRGLSPAEALVALYGASHPQGMGHFHFVPGGLSIQGAEKRLAMHPYVDYLKGRIIKVSFSEDELYLGLYDRDNGPGAGRKALESYIVAKE